ncbi:thiopeptide-type bacteriocin biosynthesis protein [Chryseobacterium viscerum]|uniref:Lantibiotic dehydratase n=1 Tax=Chryseobacterium viscerum TaxID=1037377 RepID=A0A316WMN5_9FLAO|nr:thiopeptide-type bacteriocin biosynthesis protein [Chryseobacterium viscerum]PWN60438.1 lantibiotic dehydratase [Chryseobacterium viscerum]
MVTRKFHPGSEWLYFKLYTGVKTSDIILQEVLEPFVEQLQHQNLIRKWFFIRYNDPKSHLRVRLHINNQNDYGSILERINSLFKEYLESGEVSAVIIETYSRELERYGDNTIEYAEEFFFKSSELILNFLEYNDEEKMMVSLFYIDHLLTALPLSAEEKTECIKNFEKAFKKEFNADKNLNNQLKKKYNEFYPGYVEFMISEEYESIRDLIQNNILEIKPKLEKILELKNDNSLKIPIEDLFQSIFHMHINRLFVSNQRLFEMVIYDHLYRFYRVNKVHPIKIND